MRLRPQTFSGEAEEDDVEGWLLHFDNICDVNGTMREAQKIGLLSVSATSTATRWVQTNARWPNQDVQTLLEVRNKFRERFTNDDVEEKIHASLKSLRQEDSETVREYLGRIRELVVRSSEVEEAVWYRSRMEGLTRPVHEAVIYSRYQDINDAAKILRRKGRAMGDPTRQRNEGKKEVGSRSGDAQAGSVEALVQMIGEWALHERDMGVRFPLNHHSTIRDRMHREIHEPAE